MLRVMGLEDEFFEGKIEPDRHKLKDIFSHWMEGVLLILVAGLGVAIFFLFNSVSNLDSNVNGQRAQQDRIEANQGEAEIRGYKVRAVNCQTLIADNDRSDDITSDCTDPEIVIYYPPSICAQLGQPLGPDGSEPGGQLCGDQFEAGAVVPVG